MAHGTSDSHPQLGPAAAAAEQARAEGVNAQRAAGRGYLVFATDPERSPEESGYRHVFATEARTPAEPRGNVRPLAPGRRLRAFLVTGTYRDQLPNARWVK